MFISLLKKLAVALIFMIVTGMGLFQDQFGNYHFQQGLLQSVQVYAGYNDLYDYVFSNVASMERAKFRFNSGGEEFMIWAWKGDYPFLGLGAELGLYRGGGAHWSSYVEYPMDMSVKVYFTDNLILAWREKNWWISGMNPAYQGVHVSSVRAVYTIAFNDGDMFEDFIKSEDYLQNQDMWTVIDAEKYVVEFVF